MDGLCSCRSRVRGELGRSRRLALSAAEPNGQEVESVSSSRAFARAGQKQHDCLLSLLPSNHIPFYTLPAMSF